MRARPTGPLHLYVTAVAGAGVLVLFYLALPSLGAFLESPPPALWLFAVLTVLGELWPLKVRRGDEGGAVTTSSAFSFAILLSVGLAPAVFVQGLASLIADLWGRKGLMRIAFNLGQYVLSFAAAGVVLVLVTSTPVLVVDAALALHHLPALVLAGITVFGVQILLTGGVIALASHASVWDSLRSDFVFNVSTVGVLLTLSPILAVVADRSIALIPLLLLTVMAVYKSAHRNIEKEHLALHDLLTDLPNRRLFNDLATKALYEGKRTSAPVAVLMVDLDRFKEINDTLGHHVGDKVLQEIGPRLEGAVREIDTIARLGGDEFAILLDEVSDAETALAVATRVVEALEEPIVVQGFPLDIAASVGVAMYPEHGEDVESLIQHADVAMYTAKKEGIGAALYSTERDRQGRGRLALLGELRTAIDESQLLLHYQPKAEMRSGRVRGVEALVRWQHPDLGMVPPDDFIPLAENTELIGPLTRYVLNQALQQVSVWHAEGLMLSVAVNLSVQNLYDVQFPVDVARLLGKWGVDASWLELEITENTVMADPTRAQRILEELAGMGVRIAIDDFGTGYSSLAHLRELPVADIKIDKSFVMHLDRNDNDAVIVRSIIDLARNLGLHVVAEGVENDEVWDMLADAGCHAAQGYHLCRPVPGPALTRWLLDTCSTGDLPRASSNGRAPGRELVSQRLMSGADPLEGQSNVSSIDQRRARKVI